MARTALCGDGDGGGSPSGTRPPWPRAPRRSLPIALAISLLAHVLVLSAGPQQRASGARAPLLVITLVAVAPRSPTRVADQSAAVVRTVQPAAAPARPHAVRVQERTAAARQPSQPAGALSLVRTMDAPPTPQSLPEFGEAGRRLAGRRIQSSVWVAADGSVDKAFVKRNEISDEVAGLLERALAGVRFTPARQDGQAVPSVLQARLCFDDAGALDTAPPECLRPDAAGAAEAQSVAPP